MADLLKPEQVAAPPSQAGSISGKQVGDLLEHYGFEFHGGAGPSALWKHPKYGISLYCDHTKTVAETKQRRTAGGACIRVRDLLHQEAAEKEKPDPLPKWLRQDEYEGMMFESREGVIKGWEKNSPEAYFTFRLSDKERDNVSGFSVQMIAFTEASLLYINQLNILIQEYGFILDRSKFPAELNYPEFDITIKLKPNSPNNLMSILQAAVERFEWCYLEQQLELIENLKSVGCEVDETRPEGKAGHGQIVVRHTLLRGEQAFSTRCSKSYSPLSIEDRSELTALLKSIRRKKDANFRREQHQPKIYTPKPEEQKQQTIIVFDSSTLIHLSAQRTVDNTPLQQTWLELIKRTAALPNVKVVIPAIIADFELRGQISSHVGRKSFCHQVDHHFADPDDKKHRCFMAMEDLFQDATRVTTEGGRPRVVHQGNPNITIWETENCRDVTSRICATLDDRSIRRRADKWNKIRSEITPGAGDRSIDCLTREVQENKPIIIVSDDFKMFETRITKTSVYGMPVGESSTYSYIRGELGVRTKEHAAALGHGTSSIIPDDVIRDIKRSHARDGVVSDRFDEREHVVVGIPEQHEKLGHPNTIRDVIEAGVNQQAESAQGHERSRRPVRARQ